MALERLASARPTSSSAPTACCRRDVHFKDLGLLVVDEEHRFGVKHKEMLKALRLSVDVLTLTATPIPRTLHLSLAGLRDLTLIETAPCATGRPSSRSSSHGTTPCSRRRSRGRLDRGGQAFMVHNRIETITTYAERVRTLAPRAPGWESRMARCRPRSSRRSWVGSSAGRSTFWCPP